jgi:hypothetical protein
MSRRIKPNSTDPRRPGGDIAGPGGPFDKNAVVISAENAVLLDHATVAQMEDSHYSDIIAMQLDGRINQTQERARILYVFDVDGAAAIITELYGVAARMGPEFFDLLRDRLDVMPGLAKEET